MRPLPVVLLVGAALIGAIAGFLVFREHSPATAAAMAVVTAPASAAANATPPPAPTIPTLVPDLSLPDLAGKPMRLRSTDGRPRLFNFWATWCEPCRREIPLLNTLQQANAAEGLRIVGIAIDFREAVQKYLKTNPLRYSSLVGEDAGLDAAQKFGMDMVLPFSVFADGQNRIVAVKVGELHRDEAEAILGEMRLLEGGKRSLPDAQAAIAATMKQLAAARVKQSSP